jgi:superfamily II DNA or RNA helicase
MNLQAIQEDMSAQLWSQAVEMVRNNAVWLGPSQTPEEKTFRVKDLNLKMTFQVTLWPGEEDWHCTCAGKADPCPHVAASAIAWKQNPNLPKEEAGGKVVYRLQGSQGILSFYREILWEGKSYPLTVSLVSLRENRVKAQAPVTPTSEDLALDVLLPAGEREGPLKSYLWAKIIPYLQAGEVTLNGTPVQVSPQETGPMVRVEDWGQGVKILGVDDPSILENFKNGMALCQELILRPLRKINLPPEALGWLSQGKTFGLKETLDLASLHLPRWGMPIDNRGRNLPQTKPMEPRLDLQTIVQGPTVHILGSIVYGQDIAARVDSLGRLEIENGKNEVPRRNLEKEETLKGDFLRTYGWPLGSPRELSGKDAQGWLPQKGPLTPRVILKDLPSGDIGFEIELEPGVGLSWEDFKKNERFFIKDGCLFELPQDWFDRYGETLRELLSLQKEHHHLPRFSHHRLADLVDQEEQRLTPLALSQEELQHLLGRLKAQPRDYQIHGITWLASLKKSGFQGALLADDMGLGKTLQTIALLEPSTLVVAPTSLLSNWKSEIERFRPDLTATIYHGSNRMFPQAHGVLITSYAILRLDLLELQSKPWTIVVLDESQAIKNPESQSSQCAFQIKAPFKICLSGTPMENHLSDLWSQFRFLSPGIFPSLRAFEEKTEQHIKEAVQPFILRRLKSQVAQELPPRTENLLWVDLSPEEEGLYRSLFLAAQKSVVEKLARGQGVMEAMELLLRLRQAACHPGLLPKSSGGSSAKVQRLIETLEGLLSNRHKALIFSQWTGFLNLLEIPLREQGWDFLRLDGSTPQWQRKTLVEQFQTKDSPQIFLLSLKAAGVGLNLTAADHVFIMDPWWNPAVENQAADRSHRIGQENPVFIHKLVARNTVEEKIILLQEHKKNLAQMILDGDGTTGLTAHELLGLLAGT